MNCSSDTTRAPQAQAACLIFHCFFHDALYSQSYKFNLKSNPEHINKTFCYI